MGTVENEHNLTGSLEDYLETIFELVRDKKLARVKDIAKARGVKAGSVSPAMRRLADLGLIEYVEREYIDLTPAGEVEARRIFAKHQLLTRFFSQILKMSKSSAEADACAIEHNLSDEGMDHIVRFFEFLQGCPEGNQLTVPGHSAQSHQNGYEKDRGKQAGDIPDGLKAQKMQDDVGAQRPGVHFFKGPEKEHAQHNQHDGAQHGEEDLEHLQEDIAVYDTEHSLSVRG